MPAKKSDKPKVLMYSTPTCPFCKMAKEFLKDKKIAFKDLNVAEDDKARSDMIEKSGQMGVPVLDINGTIIIGFDKEAIKKALKV